MYQGTHVYDSSKNRVVTTVKGMMRMEDTELFIKEGKAAIDKARPNFTVIIDYVEAEASPGNVNDKLGELREYLGSKQPKAVATVVSKMLIKSLVSQKLKGANVDPNTFGSLAEAESYLDSI